MLISFHKASLEYQAHVFQWLLEPHVQEFWDNSPEHKQDILIFMNGRKESSPYWSGIFDYWIGLADNEPFSLLMTSEVVPNDANLPEGWQAHLSKTGRTLTIDFMIGNKEFCGRGLASLTLKAFTHFMKEIDHTVDTFLIDPAASNTKAKHVYEKAGFKPVATFTRDFNEEKNVPHFLLVKNMSDKERKAQRA